MDTLTHTYTHTHLHTHTHTHTWGKSSLECCGLASLSRERAPCFLFFFFFFLSLPLVKVLQDLQQQKHSSTVYKSWELCIKNTHCTMYRTISKHCLLEVVSLLLATLTIGSSSYLMADRILLDLHPLMVISWEALSITRLVDSSELGGAGGKRILRPNKCFFFFTSFPDINLAETENKKVMGRNTQGKESV